MWMTHRGLFRDTPLFQGHYKEARMTDNDGQWCVSVCVCMCECTCVCVALFQGCSDVQERHVPYWEELSHGWWLSCPDV